VASRFQAGVLANADDSSEQAQCLGTAAIPQRTVVEFRRQHFRLRRYDPNRVLQRLARQCDLQVLWKMVPFGQHGEPPDDAEGTIRRSV